MNNFEFYVKTRKALGENCNKIYKDLKEIYGDDCPHKATIYRYAAKPDERGVETRGQPSSSLDSVQRIEALIAEDRHLSLRSIAESVELSHEAVRSIMHNNLSRRYVCAIQYSPDLNLCDRWLFSRLKRSLEHMEFNNHEEVQSQTLQLIRSIPQNEFQKELDKLFNHCQSVIDCGGDYIV